MRQQPSGHARRAGHVRAGGRRGRHGPHHHAQCGDPAPNTLVSTQSFEAARQNGVQRHRSASSVLYPEYLQTNAKVTPLREEDAYPALPQDAYGREKFITERLLTHCREAYGLPPELPASTTSTARFASGAGDGRSCRRRCVAKWRWPSSREFPPSRYGATASRRDRRAISTTVWTASRFRSVMCPVRREFVVATATPHGCAQSLSGRRA